MGQQPFLSVMSPIAVLILVGSAFVAEREPIVEYSVRVPAGVPDTIRWYPKEGGSGYLDGAGRYRGLHRMGWNVCVYFFLRNGIDVIRESPDAGGPISEVMFVQGPRVPGFDAQQDGYAECWRQLRREVLRFGKARVTRAIEGTSLEW
jgi:hypothetical protein